MLCLPSCFTRGRGMAFKLLTFTLDATTSFGNVLIDPPVRHKIVGRSYAVYHSYSTLACFGCGAITVHDDGHLSANCSSNLYVGEYCEAHGRQSLSTHKSFQLVDIEVFKLSVLNKDVFTRAPGCLSGSQKSSVTLTHSALVERASKEIGHKAARMRDELRFVAKLACVDLPPTSSFSDVFSEIDSTLIAL
eukprot:gene37568-46343_t